MYNSNSSNARNIKPHELRDCNDLAERCRNCLEPGGPASSITAMFIARGSSLEEVQALHGEASMLLESIMRRYEIPASELEDGNTQDPVSQAWHPLSELWAVLLEMRKTIQIEKARKR